MDTDATKLPYREGQKVLVEATVYQSGECHGYGWVNVYVPRFRATHRDEGETHVQLSEDAHMVGVQVERLHLAQQPKDDKPFGRADAKWILDCLFKAWNGCETESASNRAKMDSAFAVAFSRAEFGGREQATHSQLLERVRTKHAWFAGKWFLDDKKHPVYESTVNLLADVIKVLEV